MVVVVRRAARWRRWRSRRRRSIDCGGWSGALFSHRIVDWVGWSGARF